MPATSTQRTRIKICGITRGDDALAAVAAGADAIGLVFHPPSSRNLDIQQAAQLVAALPPFVTVVGVLVDPDVGWVQDVCARISLDLLQLHGDESPEICGQYGRPYIKGVRMREDIDLVAVANRFPGCRGLLLDTHVDGMVGGTGETFTWQRIPKGLAKPIILAGGLTAENVGDAIRSVRPFAVDVSSGVERSRGVKDKTKINAFIKAVRQADSDNARSYAAS